MSSTSGTMVKRSGVKRKRRVKPFRLTATRRLFDFTRPVTTEGRASVAGFPLKLRTKVVYSDGVSLNPGSVAVAKNSYSLNGLFDPDITGTGHQPMGFDNYMGVYSKYTVLATYMKVTLCVSDSNSVAFGILVHDGGQGIPTSLPVYLEMQGQCKYELVSLGASTVGQKLPVVFTKRYIAKELMRSYGDDTLSGDASNNPSAQLYGTVFVGGLGAADAGAQFLQVKIVYDVEFHNPIVNQPQN